MIFYYNLLRNKLIKFTLYNCEKLEKMFLPFDIPLIGKKAIHRRSKTVCVIDHK